MKTNKEEEQKKRENFSIWKHEDNVMWIMLQPYIHIIHKKASKRAEKKINFIIHSLSLIPYIHLFIIASIFSVHIRTHKFTHNLSTWKSHFFRITENNVRMMMRTMTTEDERRRKGKKVHELTDHQMKLLSTLLYSLDVYCTVLSQLSSFTYINFS